LIRGDLVTCSVRGDFGKPRPAVVIQSDKFAHTNSVTLVLLTGTLVKDAPLTRLEVYPTAANGLRKVSHIMIDRVTTLPKEQLGPAFGRLENDILRLVEERVAAFLGLLS
jgi:mRNA interferase MazF